MQPKKKQKNDKKVELSWLDQFYWKLLKAINVPIEVIYSSYLFSNPLEVFVKIFWQDN